MRERRAMAAEDWVMAGFNLLIGALLGSVLYGLGTLVVSGAWLLALILVVLGVVLFGFLAAFDAVFDRLFSFGIRAPKNPRPRAPKPWLRVASLPAGLLLGVFLAFLGLDRVILDLLP